MIVMFYKIKFLDKLPSTTFYEDADCYRYCYSLLAHKMFVISLLKVS